MRSNTHTFVVLAYKESIYLENCIKSVLNQRLNSEVIIATSTPNDYIKEMANKYNLELKINNEGSKGIGYDFDFALRCGETNLVTVAHQDDEYDYNYSYNVVKKYNKRKDAIIIFSDYYEIRNGQKVSKNLNLTIKRLLLSLIKIESLSNFKFIKRSCLAFGDAICCPAVTFVKNNIPFKDIFSTNMKLDIDWYAWERLSLLKGRFLYINDLLMGHRIHKDSETTNGISNNIRTKEDYIMYCKFWPRFIAKIITTLYKKSEKSNN